MKFYRITALLLKYYYISINRVDRLFDILYWPILDVLLWGFTSAFIKDISEVNILSMALGGVILWLFVWRSGQDIAVFILEDFWSRNLYHLFSSPVRLTEHILSILIWGVIRATVSFIFLSLLAYGLYAFNILTLPILFMASAIAILLLFGWAMGFFITGCIFRYGQRIQVLAWSVVWVIQPFSCVFYPLSALPAWAQPIAKILPTTHVFETLRSILFGYGEGNLLYALVATLVFMAVTSLFLLQSFKHAKRSGMFARHD
ncbi:ABC transporter permease [Candidatus Woesearchaeota archaeon]|nr:ABC transporter permease [Candidatus Woesearchaeota archaeon]